MRYIIDLSDKVKWIQYIQQTRHGTQNLKIESVYDLTPYTEPDRKAIENEVWQTAIEIDRNTDNYDWQNMTYQEAKSNYESWKKENEIHVGDEVEYTTGGKATKFVVMDIGGKYAYGFKYPCMLDDVGDYCDLEYLRKTGRHFDEIEELLKKMKGEP